MASETELLGSVKRIRAILDLVYLGRSVRGRRRVKLDGKLGAYEILITEGEEFECDQTFAKEAVMSGKAVIVSGGQVEVIPQEDGFPIYQSWVRDPAAAAVPVFEKCELLKSHFFGDGCLLEKGSKVRLDIASTPRTSICYEDEQQTESHAIRVLKISPKKLRMSQSEQQGKINAIFSQLFPANA
jgi:hypothetical protein